MRWKMSASALLALAFLIPAAPAAAQAAQPGLDAGCQTVERTAYADIRTLITIDLDAASDEEVLALANQIQSVAKAESLPVLPDAIQQRLEGTAVDLRAFLKDGVQNAWSVALRVTVTRTLTNAGPAVKAAAQTVLRTGTVDIYLAYLNEGVYVARELDCASQPTPTPSVTPSATPSVTPGVTPGATTTATPVPGLSASAAPGGAGGGGGELPLTGASTMTVVGIGGALVLLGIAGYLIGRRRSRFVA
ncbi:LPXTG cell wall anchor domain-containing protein [Catenuloplanes sp. NPDC051500]|uniref:LPXTG cell wall anchor domain-containing protein n=1 Tax=Catenuloplanes sp. NPDC051500 TaxID=3363959 RepID=UPI0037B713F8